MNNKQAKKLRREAKAIAEQQNIRKDVWYKSQPYRKVFQTFEGKLIPYVVYTATLDDCERKVYKTLKKNFKQSA